MRQRIATQFVLEPQLLMTSYILSNLIISFRGMILLISLTKITGVLLAFQLKNGQMRTGTFLTLLYRLGSIKPFPIKKDGPDFILNRLTEDERIGISDFRAEISQIIYSYKRKVGNLSFQLIKNLPKVEQLTVINQQDTKINTTIDKKGLRTLWDILELNSQHLGFGVQKRIAMACKLIR